MKMSFDDFDCYKRTLMQCLNDIGQTLSPVDTFFANSVEFRNWYLLPIGTRVWCMPVSACNTIGNSLRLSLLLAWVDEFVPFGERGGNEVLGTTENWQPQAFDLNCFSHSIWRANMRFRLECSAKLWLCMCADAIVPTQAHTHSCRVNTKYC